jgi:ER-bound oxygenase mpaB/B'/Rubber oxygenase, catalytic domain
MNSAAVSDTLLNEMQYRADPIADAAIARILGPWAESGPANGAAELLAAQATQWERLAAVNRAFERWIDNASVTHWQADPDLPAPVAAALDDYLRAACPLPVWADRAKIARAEAIFMEQGVLSCTLLFCASLPECYVVPDLAEVLHTTGRLEQRTEYRIRSTAAMIFPVMMAGGLTDPAGGGVAQVVKVRLIHAMVRHLILRGSPQDAMAALEGKRKVLGAGVVPPLLALHGAQNMHQALFAHGWKLGEDGLPCNQEELAYTLLTFGYVFLRGMRTLGVGLPRADEEACLHAWNVVGHIVGVQRELMAGSMDAAEALFERMQARGRAEPMAPDPRPALADALMRTMETLIPVRIAKPFPVLLTRHLCGRAASKDLGLTQRVSWLSRAVFALCMALIRAIDTVLRLVLPRFTIARFITRVIGLRLMSRLLMDQTRPLKLPQALLGRVGRMMSSWNHDVRAPGWLSSLEQRLSGQRADA